LAAPAALLLASLCAPAQVQGTLRIAMTASDVPTTTGAVNAARAAKLRGRAPFRRASGKISAGGDG
jgi:hypothetical protein